MRANPFRLGALSGLLCVLTAAGGGWAQEPAKAPQEKTQGSDQQSVPPLQSPAADEAAGKQKPTDKGWRPLLPEKGLEGWEISDFGSEGEVRREGELLILEMGDPLTGINLKKLNDIPTSNFEIELEAKRIEGNDFLCGLTFPVGDEFCSFIAGGWGGGLVGLSSIDGFDASENSTSTYLGFDNGKWYKFRVRVDDANVRAWIDDEEVLRQERDRHEFSTRIEVLVSRPLGLCVFQSKVAVRNFRWRPVTAAEITADQSK